MIHSRTKELKNIQVEYEFPIRVGDAAPVLLTAPASAPTTAPVRSAVLLGHRNRSYCREQVSSAAHPAAPVAGYLPWPQPAGKHTGSPQRWKGRGLRGLGLPFLITAGICYPNRLGKPESFCPRAFTGHWIGVQRFCDLHIQKTTSVIIL